MEKVKISVGIAYRFSQLIKSQGKDLGFVQDCRLLLELLGHTSSVFTVDLSDSHVISGDKDETILWSLADGTILRHVIQKVQGSWIDTPRVVIQSIRNPTWSQIVEGHLLSTFSKGHHFYTLSQKGLHQQNCRIA